MSANPPCLGGIHTGKKYIGAQHTIPLDEDNGPGYKGTRGTFRDEEVTQLRHFIVMHQREGTVQKYPLLGEVSYLAGEVGKDE